MLRRASWRGVRLFTIGHSTRTAAELIAILRDVGVSIVADIRTVPRSRHNPQFEGKVLRVALRRHHLRYVHLPARCRDGFAARTSSTSPAPAARRRTA